MSAYYRFFPGDYMRDTVHLGWLEDCAYRRLIDLYQIHGKPIRNDRSYILRAVRASEPEQQAAVDTVLSEFFALKVDGWHQKKCDSEIEFRHSATNHAKKAAEQRWKKTANENNKDNDARALLGHCSGYANQNQNQNHNEKIKPIGSRKRSPVFVLPEWLLKDKDVWDAWVEARTKSKKPPTNWAKSLAVTKLERMKEEGHNTRRLLADAAYNNWQSFYPPKETA